LEGERVIVVVLTVLAAVVKLDWPPRLLLIICLELFSAVVLAAFTFMLWKGVFMRFVWLS